MEPTEKKYNNFIGDLKSSNIASNINSLAFFSEQIELLLEQIMLNQSDKLLDSNLDNSKKIIEKAKNINSIELTDYYIKFGEILRSIVSDLKRNEQNLKYLKKIAIHYLDVAKLTKDERIKQNAFAIADELSN